jgi:hypothetical protein
MTETTGPRIVMTINPETISPKATNPQSINLEIINPGTIILKTLLGAMTEGMIMALRRTKREERTEGERGVGVSGPKNRGTRRS